ncbi:hypothetical protein HPB48_015025 [Haemaphysalis longicornis]|uniref:Uncharacterized protein n=1 Tax=Haemaphysalis longicornis TaxID=44386 RepID=A0A9J6FJK7_HAELO|nr:hypothetical protein HPB48_015025 [Haemaphysalis longicornis]
MLAIPQVDRRLPLERPRRTPNGRVPQYLKSHQPGCRIVNPHEKPACVPKSGLCGDKRLPADQACKARLYRKTVRGGPLAPDAALSEQRPQPREKSSYRATHTQHTSSRSRSRTPARKGSHQTRRRSRSRSRRGPNRAGRTTSAGLKGSRRWETKGKGGSRGSHGRRHGSCSRFRTRLRAQAESNRRGILSQKKVSWTDRSSVALSTYRDVQPRNPSTPSL